MASDILKHLVTEGGRRCIQPFLAPLLPLQNVQTDFLGPFEIGGEKYSLPRLTFSGPNSSDPIRIALFGSIHGDEAAGALALAQLLMEVAQKP